MPDENEITALIAAARSSLMAFKPLGERGPTVWRDMDGIAPEHVERLSRLPKLRRAAPVTGTEPCAQCAQRASGATNAGASLAPTAGIDGNNALLASAAVYLANRLLPHVDGSGDAAYLPPNPALRDSPAQWQVLQVLRVGRPREHAPMRLLPRKRGQPPRAQDIIPLPSAVDADAIEAFRRTFRPNSLPCGWSASLGDRFETEVVFNDSLLLPLEDTSDWEAAQEKIAAKVAEYSKALQEFINTRGIPSAFFPHTVDLLDYVERRICQRFQELLSGVKPCEVPCEIACSGEAYDLIGAGCNMRKMLEFTPRIETVETIDKATGRTVTTQYKAWRFEAQCYVVLAGWARIECVETGF